MAARICANCGTRGAIRFKNEAFTVSHAGLTTEVKGFCTACGEIEFEGESAHRYAAADDALVL